MSSLKHDLLFALRCWVAGVAILLGTVYVTLWLMDLF